MQYIPKGKTEWGCGNSGELLWEYIGAYNIKHRDQYNHGQMSVGHRGMLCGSGSRVD